MLIIIVLLFWRQQTMTDPEQTKSPNHNAKMTLTLSNKAIVREFNFSNTLCIERSEGDQKKKPDIL